MKNEKRIQKTIEIRWDQNGNQKIIENSWTMTAEEAAAMIFQRTCKSGDFENQIIKRLAKDSFVFCDEDEDETTATVYCPWGEEEAIEEDGWLNFAEDAEKEIKERLLSLEYAE
jgi:hypothetical protein